MRQLLFYMNKYKNKQYSWSGHILILGQHRIIPALRLKHRSGGSPRQEPPQAAVALRSASLRLGVRHGICVAKMLDNTQSIICAFGLAAAAPRSPYRHLELCGIALELEKLANSGTFTSRLQAFSNLWQKT